MPTDASKMVAAWLMQYGGLPPAAKEHPNIEALQRRLSRKLRELHGGVEAELVRQLLDRGFIPSNDYSRRKLIQKVMGHIGPMFADLVADAAVESAQLAAQETAALAAASAGAEISLVEPSKKVLERIRERAYVFSADTYSRIQGNFAKSLATAYEQGLGIDDAIRGIRDDFYGLRHHRLEAIARTEIQGSQNEITQNILERLNMSFKQWITVDDDRVRGDGPYDQFDHIEMHGQVVRINEPFSNGMMHPGDRTAEPGDFINCRCRARPYIPRPTERIIDTPYYP